MVIALKDKWIWDSWYAKDGDTYHGFFLQADRALGDPDLRHFNVSQGHATSVDLVNWTHLGTMLRPSEARDAERDLLDGPHLLPRAGAVILAQRSRLQKHHRIASRGGVIAARQEENRVPVRTMAKASTKPSTTGAGVGGRLRSGV